MAPFSSFATYHWTLGPAKLERFNGVGSLELQGTPAPGQSSGTAMDEVQKLFRQLPKGVGLEWTGLSYQERLSSGQAPYLYALSLLVETNGPGGYYCELGRTCVLGDIPAEMEDEFAFVLEARKFTLDLLKMGTACKTIWDEYNAFMERNGRPKEARLYCHGQGYDLVERPLVRADETMSLAENMNLAVHPGYETDAVWAVICDNYLVEADGVSECLHRTEKKIFEV